MKWLVAIFLLVTGAALSAPDASLRPVVRSTPASSAETPGATPQASDTRAETITAKNEQAVSQSLRPEVRPRKFRRIARERERLRKRGAVCGSLDIQGDVVGRVRGSKSGCGVENAVRVKTVSGIELSQQAVMDCGTASALQTWLDNTAKPAFAHTGGGLKSLRIAAHYVCRTRNNQSGGRVSEHGKGRAIDISAFRLQDGTLITVQNGWNGAKTAKTMHRLHIGACGPFGTVLGPNSDRFHRDHFHFDTARYRSGPYCR